MSAFLAFMSWTIKLLILGIGTLSLFITPKVYAGTVQANSPSCLSAPPGLITWLSADGHSLDVQGEHPATLTGGTSFAPGRVGQAFSLDGVDDALDLGTWFDLQTFSISMWIKEGDVQGPAADILDLNHTGFRGFVIQNYAQPMHEYHFGIAGTGAIGTFQLSPGVWQHLLISRDSNGMARLYLDGELIGEASGGPVVYDGSQFLRIGRWGGGGRHWRGEIDEFDIYDRALSATEVAAIHAAGSTGKCRLCMEPSPGLIGWWPADGTAANLACGASASLQSGTSFAPGVVQQAFSFDGVDDYADIGAGYNLQTFTYALWIKEGDEQQPGFIDILDTDHRANVGVHIQGGHGAPHEYNVAAGGTDALPFSLRPNTWQHVAFSRGGDGALRLYLDGQLVSSVVGGPVVYHGSEFLRLGRWGGGGRNWRGEIDEFRIYSRAISAEEVTALYRSGKAGESWPCAERPAGMVGWWPGEGSPENRLGDNSGTVLGGASYVAGVVGKAFNLDGVENLVAIGDLPELNGTTGLTLMAWVRKAPGPNHIGGILAKWDTGPNPSANSFLLFNGEDDYLNRGGFALQFDDDTSAVVKGLALIPENTWVHIAATWNNGDGQMRLYKNGVMENSVTGGLGKTLRHHTLFTAKIGEWGLDNRPNSKWNGAIDEPMIFRRAVTPGEIAAIHSAGPAGICHIEAAAELVIRSVTGPQSLIPGELATVSYTIANEGQSPAVGPWKDAVFVSSDTNAGADYLLNTFVITNTLQPGATTTFNQLVVIPTNGPAGKLYFGASIDAGNAVVEANESNNTLIETSGATVPQRLTLGLAATEVTEDSSTISASVTRNGDLTAPLSVVLASSDSSEATVPNSVVIPTGQATVRFVLQVHRDHQLDGPQTVTVTAEAGDFQLAREQLTVLDIDLPALALSFNPVRVVEGEISTATLTRQGSTLGPLTVNLEGPRTLLDLPLSVSLPAGQASTKFTVAVLDDSWPRSSRSNLITAAVVGYRSSSALLIADDDDVPILNLTLSSLSASEGAGPLTVTGLASRSIPSPRPLTVSLLTANPALAQVPATVTIPAGATDALFNVAVTDNSLVDGNRNVAISAALVESGTGLTLAGAGPVTLTITDDDGPALHLELSADVVGEGLNPAAIGTVRRNTGTTGPLQIALSSDSPDQATVPATLIIPAGADSATFFVASVADGRNDGSRFAVITAAAAGFAGSARTIVVTDADMPDLVLANFDAPAKVTTDSSFSFRFRVQNAGLATSGSNSLQRVLFSLDPLPSSEDEVLLESRIDRSIQAGQFVEQTFQVRSPKSPGDYYLIVVADADHRVPEILENNNTLVSPKVIRAEKAYRATVATDVTVAPPSTSVNLMGTATLTANDAPAAFVPVEVTIRVRDTERHLTALTDASGKYNATFQPLPGEAGIYALAADYPGITGSPVQDTFSLLGFTIEPFPRSLRLAEGTSVSVATSIKNLANVPLTQLTASVMSGPTGVTINPSLSNASLSGDGSATLTLGIMAAPGAVNGSALVRVSSAEGAAADLSVPITIELARPRLVATPHTLEAGMSRGSQTTVQFGVTNTGGSITGPLTIMAPTASWLRVASGTLMVPLAPGEGTAVSLLLTPAADLELGPYTGSFVLNATNAAVSVPFTFRNLSEKLGSLQIETVDEFTYYAAGSPKLTNAAVRILDSVSKEVVVTNATDAAGSVVFSDLREAYYDLEIEAEGHSAYKATILLEGGKTNRMTAFLSRQTVRYVFSVVPTGIEDRTRIEINTQFEAFVPIPVLTVDPPYFDLSSWSGSLTQVNVTLMNHGLLAAENVRFALPEHPEVEFISLVSDIGTLQARSSVTIPIVIRRASPIGLASVSAHRAVRRQATPGGSCYADASFSFDLVCGPQVNTYDIPLRFDQLPGCPKRIYTVFDPPVFAPFTYSGGGGQTSEPITPSCPDCFPSSPELFLPPRESAAPNNCNPCIAGAAEAAVCLGLRSAPGEAADAAWCLLSAALCTSGIQKQVDLKSALACLSTVGTCLGGAAGRWLETPDCLFKLKPCTEGNLGGGMAGLASLPKRMVAKQALADLPSEVEPLFRQVDRLGAFLAPITNLLGAPAWFQTIDQVGWSNWFSGFSSRIGTDSADAERLTTVETDELLALPFPTASLTANDIRRFISRWNRTVDYYNQGVFAVAQVPDGESTDFVAADLAAAFGEAATAAHAAAVADGYSDPFAAVTQAAEEFLAQARNAGGGVCATVKLKIEQEAVITRDGFNATLEIVNDTDHPLTGIAVELSFRSEAGQVSTHLFAVRPPTLNGLGAVDGTGRIAARSSGQISWILVPTSEAAPEGPVTHVVGGTLRYQHEGNRVSVPLTPSSINVLPNSSLALKYFHQRDVFADDPFTDEIEPSIPYSLAVLIENRGKGTARHVRISSAQPKIVENQKGLLIDFSILATEVAGQALTPSLTADFGDIRPGEIKIGRWLLKSSLQGLFTEYAASFEHVDGLGDKRLSLIQSVEIHELTRVVQADRAFEDHQPDFLANDVPDLSDLPDTLHLSQGTNMPVTAVTSATASGPIDVGRLNITVSAAMPAGWGYLRIPEPSGGRFHLKEVRRSDNSALAFGTNVWVTDRTFIGFSQRPLREHVLHLLDFNGAGPYHLTYEALGPADTAPPSSAVAVLPVQSPAAIPVSWSGSDNIGGSGLAYYDVHVSVNGSAFVPWLRRTAENGALYPGEIGKSYIFYSTATDFAGNQEAAPTTPDAHTTVSVVNTAPTLTVAADQTVDEGATVVLASTALDNDIPANSLTWSLGPNAPASAQINPSTGLVIWPTGEGAGPSTNQFTIIVRDNGQPALTATGRVAVIVREVLAAPVLEAITNRVVDELRTVRFQARASDTDLPANALRFSLVNAPAGATISSLGLFNWTPDRLQGPSTNVIQVRVTDDGIPPLSSERSFTVIVRDSEGDFDLIAGSLVARLAPELSVPFSINSGLDLREISFTLDLSSERLQDFSLEPLIPELSTVTLTPDGLTRLHVRLAAGPGELLQGNRALAHLTFSPGTNEHSEIVTLLPHSITARRASGLAVPAASGRAGRVVLIGLEPLLLAERGSPDALKLFGIPERSYVLEQTPSIEPPAVWSILLQYKQRDLLDTLPVRMEDELRFYRLREP